MDILNTTETIVEGKHECTQVHTLTGAGDNSVPRAAPEEDPIRLGLLHPNS